MKHLSLLASILLLGATGTSVADDHRAKNNYMLNCQGCHTPDGSGHEGRNIPTLTNYMGKFLQVEGGREFLIQVPGASQSLLNDEELAELTNWMIKSFDPQSHNDGFQPYSAAEVHELRKVKITDFTGTRQTLVKKIRARNL